MIARPSDFETYFRVVRKCSPWFSACAALVLVACQQSDRPQPILDERSTAPVVFVGEVLTVQQDESRRLVELFNPSLEESRMVLINPAGVQNQNGKDLPELENGIMLKITGAPVELNGKSGLTATSLLWHRPVQFSFDARAATAFEKQRCLNANGRVRQAGRGGFEVCVQSFPDAGDACRDASECFGQCRLDVENLNLDPGAEATGICASDNLDFGCHALVSDGRYEGTLFVD